MRMKSEIVFCQLLNKLLFNKPIILRHYASSIEGKMMNKVMGLRKKTKKNWYQSSVGANKSFEEIIKQTTKNESGHSKNKRVNVLNNILMQYITDLMTTGEIFDKIVGYGLEITRVSISSDYKSVKVYWLSRSINDIPELEILLHSISGLLRHELSNLRIMGEVPIIRFFRDKTFDNVEAVNELLKKADFGEDFVPTCPTLMDNYQTIFTNFEPEIKCKIKELEDQEIIKEEEEKEIPPMKMDVMGLDHAAITLKISLALQKSKAVHRQFNITQNIVKNSNTNNQNSQIEYVSFSDFVKKRKIQQAKAYIARNNYNEEIFNDSIDEDITFNDSIEENCDDEYPFKI
ncbi:putative ribosome-binding factor A, mitochondrial [Daktulosphaira vitifoliae]|uniref:putative ribosome-binding factor A, mitochondrial n=1 Tax=Daktulosphaira vitifoliae TaxID=58002 RepID=UPI0021A9B600|nr:putative ribosome-binding factor A, mitochondrial [Daktulosphaira vitifoliae]